MNSTIEDITRKTSAIIMIGHNRSHSIGSTCWKVAKQNWNKESKTRFVKIWPVMWWDDGWHSIAGSQRPLIKEWNQPVTVIEKLSPK